MNTSDLVKGDRFNDPGCNIENEELDLQLVMDKAVSCHAVTSGISAKSILYYSGLRHGCTEKFAKYFLVGSGVQLF